VTRWDPAPPPSLAELVTEDLRDAMTQPLRRLAAAPGLLHRITTDDLRDYGHGLGQLVRALTEPAADSLNGPIGPGRRWAWITAELAELKRIRAARGATIDDVVLAAITRGFRDLLSERGELTGQMVVRTVVPVSVRGQDEAGAVTNRVSAVLANLPVSEPDPLRRLGLIQREMDGLKHTHQAVSAEALTGLTGLVLAFAPAWLAFGTQAAFRTPQLLVQSVTTNVPGPRRPLYVLGRRLTALHPYVPIGSTVRISVAILSYAGTVSFGVTADDDFALDLDAFTEGIQRGLAELTTADA
jgi:WS/DGAT/MGAT family acyltransferase